MVFGDYVVRSAETSRVGGGVPTGKPRPGASKHVPDTPLDNLFLSLLDRMDSGVDQLGDSTGRLKGLDG